MNALLPIKNKLGNIVAYSKIDLCDAAFLNQFTWGLDRYGYARRANSFSESQLARVIVNPPPSLLVDHKNGDVLDNRRSNLRVCTKIQNGQNRKLGKNNTTGFKGVSRHRKNFKASIKLAGKAIHLGTFNNPLEAARAYNDAALRCFGEFARVNPI